MEQYYSGKNLRMKNDSRIKLLPILFLFGLVIIGGLSVLVFTSENLDFLERPYLLPWVFLTGATVAVPISYLWYKNKFRIYHPLVFPGLFYFLPAFFIGGLILVFGLSEPYYVRFIQDQKTNLPYTFLVIICGFIGLSIGFFIPFGGFIGRSVSLYLPVWNWRDENVIVPGIILLILGFINNIIGFLLGITGFQKAVESNSYDGLIFLSTLLWIQASFMLWIALFRKRVWNVREYLIIAVLIVISLINALFAGNRGGLLQAFLIILFGYIFAGKVIRFKQGLFLTSVLVTVVVIGMIYGTTFRQVKGTEDRVETSSYIDSISKTFDTIGNRELDTVLLQSFYNLAERLEAVTSLAVVVSNYEKLKPYEESYGIDNNIYKDLATFFIPRIIWKDKPVSSVPRRYSELYFDFGENSFTITPMGDLLRNFGFAGVPLGMLLLGFIGRIFYSALMENQPFSYWRSILYFMIVPSISYEGFYGTIVPTMFKVGFISIVGILITHFLITRVFRKT